MLRGDDQEAARWTCLDQFEPEEMAGPWSLLERQLRSERFRIVSDAEEHSTLFLGGPCYLGWEKSGRDWRPRWNPLLYREVKVRGAGKQLEIVPGLGPWCISPLADRSPSRRRNPSLFAARGSARSSPRRIPPALHCAARPSRRARCICSPAWNCLVKPTPLILLIFLKSSMARLSSCWSSLILVLDGLTFSILAR